MLVGCCPNWLDRRERLAEPGKAGFEAAIGEARGRRAGAGCVSGKWSGGKRREGRLHRIRIRVGLRDCGWEGRADVVEPGVGGDEERKEREEEKRRMHRQIKEVDGFDRGSFVDWVFDGLILSVEGEDRNDGRRQTAIYI